MITAGSLRLLKVHPTQAIPIEIFFSKGKRLDGKEQPDLYLNLPSSLKRQRMGKRVKMAKYR